jgi:hypothetical protein
LLSANLKKIVHRDTDSDQGHPNEARTVNNVTTNDVHFVVLSKACLHNKNKNQHSIYWIQNTMHHIPNPLTTTHSIYWIQNTMHHIQNTMHHTPNPLTTTPVLTFILVNYLRRPLSFWLSALRFLEPTDTQNKNGTQKFLREQHSEPL